MRVFKAVSVQSLLSVFWIFQTRALSAGAEHIIEDAVGDLLFVMDSSGSILPYEYTGLKEFVADLLKPFTIGPEDVQISFVQVSDDPVVEFPFGKYTSITATQWAILNMKQKLGDTNTGKALAHAQDTMFTQKGGARPDVPKVLVWLTDGASSDDISQPIKFLKDQGVTVFIVSIGRGNYIELKAAASEPTERRLYYVDPEDMHIIMEELRNEILDIIQVKKLRAMDITATSFRLSWPRLLSDSADYYLIEYSPLMDPQKSWKTVTREETSVVLRQLLPKTTYEVKLTPINDNYNKFLETVVTTLEETPEELSPQVVVISDSQPRSFQVSWAPTPHSVASYEVLYGVLPGGRTNLLSISGDQNITIVNNLEPNTTYLVTVSAIYQSGRTEALSVKACTQDVSSEGSKLKLINISSTGVAALWDPAQGKVLHYRVRCIRHRRSPSVRTVPPQARGVLLTDLIPGTENRICVRAVYRNGVGRASCGTIRTPQQQDILSPEKQSTKSFCTQKHQCWQKR
ncbi:von Willebrand factor A domain-containing protein 1 [Hypanus sabinus]|uniref:von Willebrand factor A domain-containing protein 1 n=1 Tax=Hypanus sabinus TaxID=79690 RepID=UPI0028C510E0|nr:von Willebrand factor A domain-containing protein 1 [Hypanus sabinus]